jgi:hypothetical protein
MTTRKRPDMDGAADSVVQKHTILFIDDEPRVLTSMRAMFRREYDVFQPTVDLRRCASRPQSRCDRIRPADAGHDWRQC